MNRGVPQTTILEDILLMLVLVKSLLDLHAGGAALLMLPAAFAVLLGLRSTSVARWLRVLLTGATLAAWFAALQTEAPDLVLLFAGVAVAMLIAYSIVDLWLFGLRPGSGWGIIVLLFVLLLVVSSCSTSLVGRDDESPAWPLQMLPAGHEKPKPSQPLIY